MSAAGPAFSALCRRQCAQPAVSRRARDALVLAELTAFGLASVRGRSTRARRPSRAHRALDRVVGLRRRAAHDRLRAPSAPVPVRGLGLHGFVAINLLLIDLAGAPQAYRVLSFLVTGALMIAVSYAYKRRKEPMA